MKNIDFICPINPTGYGQHGLNLSLELIKLTDKIRIFPIGDIQCSKEQYAQLEPFIAKKDINKNNIVVKLWHETDISDSIKGNPFIYYPVFEIESFNQEQLNKFKTVNNYFVVSEWHKTVLLKTVNSNKERTITVVPEGVSNDITYSTLRNPLFALPTYINIGKHEHRKGTYQLVDSMKFIPHKINLILHCYNPFNPNSITKICNFGKMKNVIKLPGITDPIFLSWYQIGNVNIYLSERFISRENYLKLISYCDYGIFPYMAEGWNLPLCEVMASGIPCLASDITGPTEYLESDNHHSFALQRDFGYYDWISKVYPHAYNQNFFRVADIYKDMISINNRAETIRNNLAGFKEKWLWSSAAKKFLLACSQYE